MNCFYHPKNKAVNYCATCGAPMCNDCLNDLLRKAEGNRVWCNRCSIDFFNEQIAKKEKDIEALRKYLGGRLAVLVISFAIVIVGMFLLLGKEYVGGALLWIIAGLIMVPRSNGPATSLDVHDAAYSATSASYSIISVLFKAAFYAIAAPIGILILLGSYASQNKKLKDMVNDVETAKRRVQSVPMPPKYMGLHNIPKAVGNALGVEEPAIEKDVPAITVHRGTEKELVGRWPLYVKDWIIEEKNKKYSVSIDVYSKTDKDSPVYSEWKIKGYDIAGREISGFENVILKKEGTYSAHNPLTLKAESSALIEVKKLEFILVLTVDGQKTVVSYENVPVEKKAIPEVEPISFSRDELRDNFLVDYGHGIAWYYYCEKNGLIVCPYCGAILDADSKTCTDCGNAVKSFSPFKKSTLTRAYNEWLETWEKQESEEKRKREEEEKLRKAEAERVRKEKEAEETAKRKKRNKTIAIVLGAIAVVSVALYLFVIKPANDKKTAIAAYESLRTEEERIEAYGTVLKWYGLPVITLKDGDEAVYSEELMPGSVIAKTLPDKDGKHFLGWAEDGSDEVLSPLVSPTVSSTLHAVYGFKAIFVGYDGQVLEEKMVKEGNQYTVDNIPDQRIGASVNKWKNTTTGETVYASTTKLNITQDVVYEAGYSLSTAFYRQDGSLYKRTTSDYGETVEFTDLASDPAFLGWSTSPDKNAPVDYASSSFKVTENNISLYLRTSNSVTYKPEGRYGENLPTSFEAETGYKLVLPGSPSQNDSVGFVGWLIANKVYSQSESVTVNGNIEIQAVYTNLKWQGSARGSYISAFVDKQGKIVSKPETVEEMKTITEYRVSQSYFTVSNSGALSLSAEGKKVINSFEYLVIPEKISGVTITEISADTFKNCTSLKSINLPKGITKIGSSAFSGCTKLVFEEFDLSNVTSLGSKAFEGVTVKKLKLNDNMKTYSSNTSYASSCWDYEIKGLQEVEYANGTEIAYRMCGVDKEGIEKIVLPYGLEQINDYVFSGCTSLTTVNIPFTVKTIGSSAFSGCTKLVLEELVLTNVTSLGSKAFEGVTVKSIKLNNNVSKYAYNTSYASSCWNYKIKGVEEVRIPYFSDYDYSKYFPNAKIVKYSF